MTNCGKTGESFVFKESKSKSFKELIKSLTPACDSSESDDDFDKAFHYYPNTHCMVLCVYKFN